MRCFNVLLHTCLFCLLVTASTNAANPSKTNRPADTADIPNLVVPNCTTAIQLAIPLQLQSEEVQGVCRLREIGGKGADICGQWSKAINKFGKPCSGEALLLAVIPPGDENSACRTFQISPVSQTAGCDNDTFDFKSTKDTTLTLSENRRPVLAYNYGMITDKDVPKSDLRQERAAYVHPIWGLDGEVITDDFPADHYHHHGLFWAWPHVSIDGKDYDLWKGIGLHHEFVRWLGRESGPAAAVLGVENGWFVGSRKVMIERVWIRVFKSSDLSRDIDVSLTWIPVGQDVSLLGAEGKSYGGLTLRYDIGRNNPPIITTPKGVSKKDLYVTRLRWADLTSMFKKDESRVDSHDSSANKVRSGIAILVPQCHPDFPPTWLTRHYGLLCIGWPGVEERTFPAGKPFSLSYRLHVHKGDMDVKSLEEVYNSYDSISKKAKWGKAK